MSEAQISQAIIVMSGKGGVGKSSIAAQIALVLSKDNTRVGLLDIDICGPSLPQMLNVVDSEIIQTDRG